MGSLFDELKKAKLIDKKKARQLEHEKRNSGKRDRDRDRDLARRGKEYSAKQRKRSEAQRSRGQEQQSEKLQKAKWAELKQLVAARALGRDAEGPMRWHFETEAGFLPFLPVSQGTAKRLESGQLGIVRDPAAAWPRFVIVPRDLAQRLRELRPELVRFLVG